MKETNKNSTAVIIGAATVALAGGYLLRGANVGAQPTAGTPAATAPVTSAPVVATPATRDATAVQNAFAQVSAAAEPAVVTITTERKALRPTSGGSENSPFGGGPEGRNPLEEFFKQFEREFGFKPNAMQRDSIRSRFHEIQARRGGGLGSGMIYRSDGLILTNAHVVAGADTVTVKLGDEREFKNAKVLGTDERTDVAVVKINATNLPTVKLGDSSAVRVGDWAIAVGNPFGLEHTLTVGVISAKTREVPLNQRSPGDYLQTDASINPGNSGGPLLDINGRVIGINNAIFSESGGNIGIGFAIPINTAREIADELIKSGKITRGYLGVKISDVTADTAVEFGLDPNTKGVLVQGVDANTPGARAGLQPGDVIVAFNGKTVTRSAELQRLVGSAVVGSTAQLRVLRGGQTITVNARLDELKEETPRTTPGAPTTPDNDTTTSPTALGLRLRALTPELAREFGVEGSRGVLVTGVVEGSPAAEVGLRRGDVIERVGQTTVTTPQAMQSAVNSILSRQSGDTKRVALYVNRKGERSYITVTTEK